MSTVYLAYHIYTRKNVAMKVRGSYAVKLKMFYREIEIMQTLEHATIGSIPPQSLSSSSG